MAYSLSPAQDDLAQDLIKYLVAQVVQGDQAQSPNFSDGGTDTQPAGVIPLWAGILQDLADDAGFLIANQDKSGGQAPRAEAAWQLTFRAKDDVTYTGRVKAHWFAKVVEQFLRPNGEERTMAVLPSGRTVLSFNQLAIQPIGQDVKQRYLVAVTFRTTLIAD